MTRKEKLKAEIERLEERIETTAMNGGDTTTYEVMLERAEEEYSQIKD